MAMPADYMTPDTLISLRTLYQSHQGKVSVKWEHYFDVYDRIFAVYRKRPVRLLEIGVQNGGSLEIWAKYFENGETFIGCDINPLCSTLAYDDERISIVAGDVNQDATRDEITRRACPLDIIIDDGSHLSGDVIKSFVQYLPVLAGDGIYVIEDLQTSYWREYGGGLYYPYSSMSFFKRLTDALNHDSWMSGKILQQYFEKFFERYGIIADAEILRCISSLEFANSMCFIRKEPSANRIQASSYVAGRDEHIVPGHAGPGGQIRYPDQSGNYWSNLDAAPDELYEANVQNVKHMQHPFDDGGRETDRRDQEILILKSAIHAMQNSRSWRLTRPLRRLMRMFHKTGT